MYRKWLHTQPLQRLWDRWIMMFLVGFVVGACAFCLHVFFKTLAETKARRGLPPPPRRAHARRGFTTALACGHGPRRLTRRAPAHSRRADEHDAIHYRQERGPRLAFQRLLLPGARRHLSRLRALGVPCRRRLGRAGGDGVPERLPPAQGAHAPAAPASLAACGAPRAVEQMHTLRRAASCRSRRLPRRCSSGRRPPSSSCPAPAAWAPDSPLARKAP